CACRSIVVCSATHRSPRRMEAPSTGREPDAGADWIVLLAMERCRAPARVVAKRAPRQQENGPRQQRCEGPSAMKIFRLDFDDGVHRIGCRMQLHATFAFFAGCFAVALATAFARNAFAVAVAAFRPSPIAFVNC